MDSLVHQVHIFFFPFMAYGHTIPTVDMAKLFASRGVKVSIITTPHNAPLFSRTIERTKNMGVDIDIKIISFPAVEAGLPEGMESLDMITSTENGMKLIGKFLVAIDMLQEPLEKLLQDFRPDCVVADVFFPWVTDAASKFGIPRLVFHGTSFFSLCTGECLRLYQPHKDVSSDSELFVVPKLPHEVKLTKKHLGQHDKEETPFTKLIQAAREAEGKSFGVIVNSFYELEPAYADFYRSFLGRRAWHVGPVSLCNEEIEDKAHRGKEATIDENECLRWLDSKKPSSVIYICFGSVSNITSIQLKEIAAALEASGQDFIWVVRRMEKKNGTIHEEKDDWLPEGFEERMKGKGLIIRGWAPQVLILDHEAVGGFVTHCGWNSTLEGITSGKPLVTWPLFAEQFFNEKLVTEELKIGVDVGAKEWVFLSGDFVSGEALEKAIKRIMVGEEAEELRTRAKNLGEAARKAIQVGGSSYSDFDALLGELRLYQPRK